jgi:hypothetical protein
MQRPDFNSYRSSRVANHPLWFSQFDVQEPALGAIEPPLLGFLDSL